MEMLLNCNIFVLFYSFCGFRSKQSMKDDIRKTIASIFLMVKEKLPFHGGVNGLVSGLIINYEITGVIFYKSIT